MKWLETLTFVILILLLAICVDFVLAAVVMWIWNLVMPAVFTGVSTITFWQSFGLMVLVSMFKINVNTGSTK